MLTKFHLIEWIPAFEQGSDSFLDRLGLADRLPTVVYSPYGIQEVISQPLTLDGVTARELIHIFFNERGDGPDPGLSRERIKLLVMGEGNFFSRNARRTRYDQPVNEERYLEKYLKLNERHGSDPSGLWEQSQRVEEIAEAAFEAGEKLANSYPISAIQRVFEKTRIGQILRRSHSNLQKRAERFYDTLFEWEPRLLAHAFNVTAEHPPFRLWYEMRQELYRDPGEQGGLAEVIDLYELLYFDASALITVDKRIHHHLKQVLRRWEHIDVDSVFK